MVNQIFQKDFLIYGRTTNSLGISKMSISEPRDFVEISVRDTDCQGALMYSEYSI
ncbi:MAG: hypothetical protein ACFFED_12010 [Candidatus Thorarchaeota archaeon]